MSQRSILLLLLACLTGACTPASDREGAAEHQANTSISSPGHQTLPAASEHRPVPERKAQPRPAARKHPKPRGYAAAQSQPSPDTASERHAALRTGGGIPKSPDRVAFYYWDECVMVGFGMPPHCGD